MSETKHEIPPATPSLLQPDRNSTSIILTNLPTPTAKPNTTEHLIKVYSTAPCSGELLWAKNFPDALNLNDGSGRILVPCYDLSGVVVTAPTDSPFQPGTEVYTRTTAGRTGNARGYTIALTEELAVKPKGISWDEAASVPLSAFTALQALFEHGGVDQSGLLEESKESVEKMKEKNGKLSVLVTGASGGVGVWIVQLAKAAGVKDVVGVCGTGNVEFVKGLGATDIIDYRKNSIKEWIEKERTTDEEKFDLVIDCVGGNTLVGCWYAVKSGGTFISISAPPEGVRPEDVKTEGVRSLFFIMESIGKQLAPVTRLLEKGEVKTVIDSVWRLEDYEKAFAKLETGHARGKIIIKVSE